MECVPGTNAAVVKVAFPPLSVPVPKVAAPFLKVTDPLGVPIEPATVAVNVTDWPKLEGLSEEIKVVVLAIFFTTCDRMLEVLPEKIPPPAYTAWMLCVPPVRAAVVNEACPPLRLPDPIAVAPS